MVASGKRWRSSLASAGALRERAGRPPHTPAKIARARLDCSCPLFLPLSAGSSPRVLERGRKSSKGLAVLSEACRARLRCRLHPPPSSVPPSAPPAAPGPPERARRRPPAPQLDAPPAPQLKLITAPQLQFTSAVILPPPAPAVVPVLWASRVLPIGMPVGVPVPLLDLPLPPLLPCIMPRLSYPAAPPPALAVPSRAPELLSAAAAHRAVSCSCGAGT